MGADTDDATGEIQASDRAGDQNSAKQPSLDTDKLKPAQGQEPEADLDLSKKQRKRRGRTAPLTYSPLSFVQVGSELLTKLCIKLKLRPLCPAPDDFAYLAGDLKQALHSGADFKPRFEYYQELCPAADKLLEEHACAKVQDGPHKLIGQLCLCLELALKKRGIDLKAGKIEAFLKTLGLIRLKNGLYVTVAGSYGLDGSCFVKNDERLLSALCEECSFPPLPQIMEVVQVREYFALQTLIPKKEGAAPDEFEVSQDLALYEDDAQARPKKKRRSAKKDAKEDLPQIAQQVQGHELEAKDAVQENQEPIQKPEDNESKEPVADTGVEKQPSSEVLEDGDTAQESLTKIEQEVAASESTAEKPSAGFDLGQEDLKEDASGSYVEKQSASGVLEDGNTAQESAPEPESKDSFCAALDAQTSEPERQKDEEDTLKANDDATAQSIGDQTAPSDGKENLLAPDPAKQDELANAVSCDTEDLKAKQAPAAALPKSRALNEAKAPKRGRKKKEGSLHQLDLFAQLDE